LELSGAYSRTDVVDHEAFVVLCDVIQRKSTTLTTLKLNLWFSELGSDAHQDLCKSLFNLFPRLHQLELKFHGGDLASDDSLPLLGDLLGNGSNSLKILALDFHSCYGVTRKGAQEFAEKLKKGIFPLVEKLEIYFRFMPKLRFEGLFYIVEAVSVAFPNVKDLMLESHLDRRRYSDKNYVPNDNTIQIKAEMILKKKLKKLAKNFRLNWSL